MKSSLPVVVMKFGGTATGSARRMQRIGTVAKDAHKTVRPVLVVSALSGITRRLDRGLQGVVAAREAEEVKAASVVDALLTDLRARHRTQARDVLPRASASAYEAVLQEQLDALRIRLNTVTDTGFTPALRDAVLATGEQLSVPMVVATLRAAGLDAKAGDATALIQTDATYGEANVHLDDSRARVTDWFTALPDDIVPVVAGFVGADAAGATTTLGFEGSDYTAALMASFLRADSLTRFTDVDGIYTADPNTDAAAQHLDRLTMEQAFAWTESGRLGMHPKTLRPLVERAIPMQVRSIDRPTAPGTQIVPNAAGTPTFWPPLTP